MSNYKDLEELYEVLVMENENGEEEEFFVIDAIELENTPYFLVVEADETYDYEEDVSSYILKGVKENDDDCELEMLEEGDEYEVVMKIFSENEDAE